MASTFALPGQPSLLDGFLTLRGELVPVVLLRRLFGLPWEAPGLYTPVIVAIKSSTLLGLCVDRVLGVEDIDRASVRPLVEDHSLNDCAEGEFEDGEGWVTLINLKRLLLSEEQKRIEELSAESSRRIAEIEASRRS